MGKWPGTLSLSLKARLMERHGICTKNAFLEAIVRQQHTENIACYLTYVKVMKDSMQIIFIK